MPLLVTLLPRPSSIILRKALSSITPISSPLSVNAISIATSYNYPSSLYAYPSFLVTSSSTIIATYSPLPCLPSCCELFLPDGGHLIHLFPPAIFGPTFMLTCLQSVQHCPHQDPTSLPSFLQQVSPSYHYLSSLLYHSAYKIHLHPIYLTLPTYSFAS